MQESCQPQILPSGNSEDFGLTIASFLPAASGDKVSGYLSVYLFPAEGVEDCGMTSGCVFISRRGRRERGERCLSSLRVTYQINTGSRTAKAVSCCRSRLRHRRLPRMNLEYPLSGQTPSPNRQSQTGTFRPQENHLLKDM